MAQKVNKDIFKNAEALRDKVTKEQQAYITAMYKKWADDLAERAKEFQKKSNGSATVEQMYYQQLRKMVQEESQQVANGVYSEITDSMNKVSDAIVSDMVEWTKSFGFEGKGVDAAFANVSGSVVNSILTGSVYGEPGSWRLSKSIWGDNEKTLRDIYAVMAQGVAENLPIADIADMLSKYVNPSKELAWKGPNGATLYKKKVDYNAQRLARTLTQHTYQQSMVSSAKDNPFVKKFRWVSNGSRTCEVCKKRDGKLFNKDEVPLDHPNGQCILEPVIQDNYIDQLANWVKKPDGTYPDIDNFAKKLGHDVSKMPKLTLADIKKQYGNSHYKSPSVWYKKLPKDVQETVSKIHQASGKKWTQWYQDEMMDQSLKSSVKKAAKKASTKFSNRVLDFVKKRSGIDESWFDKIKKVTMEQMKDEEKYIRGKVPAAVKRGMKKYSSSAGCASMNRIARTAYQKNVSVIDFCEDIIHGKVTGFNEDNAKILRDMIKAYDSVRTHEDKILRRGASLGDLAGNFMKGNFDNNLAELEKMSVDELRDKFVGVIGQYNSPTSTSSMWDRGFDGDVEVIFDAPKGTHGASILDISVFGDSEGEFQLRPETRCIITDIQESDGHMGSDIRVFVKILVD